jgi:hypothetical protein
MPGVNGPRLRWVVYESNALSYSAILFTTSVPKATRLRSSFKGITASRHKTLASPASNERVRCFRNAKRGALPNSEEAIYR